MGSSSRPGRVGAQLQVEPAEHFRGGRRGAAPAARPTRGRRPARWWTMPVRQKGFWADITARLAEKSLSTASRTVIALAPEIWRWSPTPSAVSPPSVRTRHLATKLEPLAPHRPRNSSSLPRDGLAPAVKPAPQLDARPPAARGGPTSKWTAMTWSGKHWQKAPAGARHLPLVYESRATPSRKSRLRR